MTPKTKALTEAKEPRLGTLLKKAQKNPKKARKEYESWKSDMGSRIDKWSKMKTK